MPADERDRQFQQALQRHLRSGAGTACPDAEMLAAYHERTLSLEEMSAWKEHIVACSRCQETLALLEETNSVVMHEWEQKTGEVPVILMSPARSAQTTYGAEAEASLPAEAPSQRMPTPALGRVKLFPTLRWIVPVGALAAGLLVFVAVHERKPQFAPASAPVQVAENRDATPLTNNPLEQKQVAEESKLTPPKPSSNEPVRQRNDDLARYAEQGGTLSRRAASAGELAAAKKRAEAPKRESTTDMTANSTTARVASAAQPPPPASEAVGGASAEVSPAPRATQAWSATKKTEGLSMDRAAVESVETPAQANEYSSPSQVAAANPSLIKAAGGQVYWRVAAGGKIEMSADVGKTWVKQSSGVTNDLITGSAPSEKVCWVVGKAGTLLMTVDGGAHWKQIVSPIQGELGGVQAIDAQHATVWAAIANQSFAKVKTVSTGRSFITTDGGNSWTPAANE
jgi:hypothetical protein